MPLSEHEQRLLAQMEQALVAEDPRFASSMRAARHPGAHRRRVLGGLGLGVGLGLVLLGVTFAQVWLGAIGFGLMVAGTAYALTPPAPLAVAADRTVVPDDQR